MDETKSAQRTSEIAELYERLVALSRDAVRLDLPEVARLLDNARRRVLDRHVDELGEAQAPRPKTKNPK